MTGFTVNNRGRYKCDYCDHRTYKTRGGMFTHLHDQHASQLEIDRLKAHVERLEKKPPKVEIRERVVYRDPPAKKAPEFWYIENGGGIYCETCKIVQMRVGIPRGQTIENTPHGQCGNRNLKLVLEVR